jgi:fructose-bisphosphate aldolase class I
MMAAPQHLACIISAIIKPHGMLSTLQLVAGGRGILAADESTTTVGKRLASIDVENSAPNRAALRRMLFSAPGIEQHISGAILFEETLGQADDAAGGAAADGQARLVDLLSSKGVLLGIKVDTGGRLLGAGSRVQEGLAGS